jgi:hypothetical protein
MNESGQRHTLDAPAGYRIEVAGHVEAGWSDWVTATITADTQADQPVSTITGEFDQAALHGILRRLYSLGFPLISVNRVDQPGETQKATTGQTPCHGNNKDSGGTT